MVYGAHFLIYSQNPEADRAFFRDVLQFSSVNVGEGWLIFALPPSEIAIHPGDGNFVQRHANHTMNGVVLYLMTPDLEATIGSLQAKGVSCSGIQTAPWGIATTVILPSGGEIGLYQPTHPTAVRLNP